jgi:type VI secretion system protein ImpA
LSASDLGAPEELGENAAPASVARADPVISTAPPPAGAVVSPLEAVEAPQPMEAVEALQPVEPGEMPPPLEAVETSPPLEETPQTPAVVEANAAAPAAVPLDPQIAALCTPLSEADPCGPDLDAEGDIEYLNFFASAEGTLPTSFFSVQDPTKTFFSAQDDESINAKAALPGQIAAIEPLLQRTHDMRLLVLRARLFILNRDLAGFATSIAAVAEWLDGFWDSVHPRAEADALGARISALAALDLPTVIFPLQFVTLFEAARIGAVNYRAWLVASAEVKPRPGEQKHAVSVLADAVMDADLGRLASPRRHIALVKASLDRIRKAFLARGASFGLANLPALVDRISAFINPPGSLEQQGSAETIADRARGASETDVRGPATLAEARSALEAVANYYSRQEPSSPTLPLVRQAHQLIGKSFVEVMSILIPTQVDKAAFQIGGEQIFELPLGRLPKLPEAASANAPPLAADGAANPAAYNVRSRAEAIALLNAVQRFFRAAEPSSPVPMLCERARALAERDFMGVLRDVLPKAALKAAAADK